MADNTINVFWKTTGMSRFVTSHLEILDKTKRQPWKSCKIVWHFLGMKPNSLWLFLDCPWKFYLFLIYPQEIPHVISSTFLENPSPRIANFVTSLEKTNYWSWDTRDKNFEYFLFGLSICYLYFHHFLSFIYLVSTWRKLPNFKFLNSLEINFIVPKQIFFLIYST